MLTNPYRIVVDTNLWMVTTAQLHREIMTVARRPKFQKYFGEEQVDKLEYWLTQKCTEIEIGEVVQRCRDPKDDYLLQLAVEAKAIYLVSGDEDLLVLGEVEGCRIMTMAQFQEEVARFGFV